MVDFLREFSVRAEFFRFFHFSLVFPNALPVFPAVTEHGNAKKIFKNPHAQNCFSKNRPYIDVNKKIPKAYVSAAGATTHTHKKMRERKYL